MSDRDDRVQRAGLLVLVGAVVLTNVTLRWVTDVGPVTRILLSLVIGGLVAAGAIGLVLRRPRR